MDSLGDHQGRASSRNARNCSSPGRRACSRWRRATPTPRPSMPCSGRCIPSRAAAALSASITLVGFAHVFETVLDNIRSGLLTPDPAHEGAAAGRRCAGRSRQCRAQRAGAGARPWRRYRGRSCRPGGECRKRRARSGSGKRRGSVRRYRRSRRFKSILMIRHPRSPQCGLAHRLSPVGPALRQGQ